MKNCYVSELSEGTRVDDAFLVINKSLSPSRTGSLYIRLQLSDCSGTIDGFKWDANEEIFGRVSQDDYIHIRGNARSFNGKLQIDIESFKPCNCKIDPSDFLPKSERDPQDMLAELTAIMATVKHPQLKALLGKFFDDQTFVERFTSAPGAVRIHHAYIGGLIEHSVSIAKMCDALVSNYPGVDRDILITGAILHDIGKIEEFSWKTSFKYSDSGHFVGHIVGGTLMLERAIADIPGFDPLLKLAMEHMIIAHHGMKEWGSPKRPKTLESTVLHIIDDLDAKINTFQQAIRKKTGSDDTSLWTDRHWLLERPLFRGMPGAASEPEITPSSLDDLFGDDADPSESE